MIPSPAILPVALGEPARQSGIRAAFTTRAAGNLGLDVADDPGMVHMRRAGLRQWAGREVSFANHMHGTTVLDGAQDHPSEPVGDAWCADAPVAVGVLAADCLPILLHDAGAGVIGAVHAGRVGLFEGAVHATVAGMQRRGAKTISAIIGPGICGKCYEVSEEMAAEAGSKGYPVTTSRWGTPALDLPRIAETELTGLGVGVTHFGACTLEDPRFFSHRSTDRMDGRHAGLIVMR